MKLMGAVMAAALVIVITGCDRNRETDDAVSNPAASANKTATPDSTNTTSSTTVDPATQPFDRGETYAPADDPEVVFVGSLEAPSGTLVVRYEPNSWYRESGVASLPSVGDLHWFLATGHGCLVVDRSTFINATGPGHEITITPAPGGQISIGESIPLWIEGDWLIHDGCTKGDPLILQGR